VTERAYYEPTSVEQAIATLERYADEAKVIAGGQSLLILLAEGLIQPEALVALHRIDSFSDIQETDHSLLIGANVTHQRIHTSQCLRSRLPLLAEVTGSVATVQVRNRGTLCGSVAHGFPLSDPPAALLALDAEACISGPEGDRVVPLNEFFLGFLTTQLQPTEILTHLRIPQPGPRTGTAYETLRTRPLDFPIAGVATRLTLAKDGRCTLARVALTGGGSTPARASAAEALLEGQHVTDELIAEVGESVAKEAEPAADIDGSESYKRRVLGVLTRRALERSIKAVEATA
jgi:carbon-monoxide dehydrogenase medium subunit